MTSRAGRWWLPVPPVVIDIVVVAWLFLGRVGLAAYEGQGFRFDYPAAWRVISDMETCGLHGNFVWAAVGIGDFDLVRKETSYPDGSRSISCGPVKWTLPDGGVVLAYQDWALPRLVEPAGLELAPGDRWMSIDGRSALLSETSATMTWHFDQSFDWIEVRMSPGTAAANRDVVSRVLASWRWKETPGS